MEVIAQRTKTKNMMVLIGLHLEDEDVVADTTADADAYVIQDPSAFSCLLKNSVKSVLKRTRQSTLGVWQRTM